MDSTCFNDCDACSANGGPGAGGCYWDAELLGSCLNYWSSATDNLSGVAGTVNFDTGAVNRSDMKADDSVRCVR